MKTTITSPLRGLSFLVLAAARLRVGAVAGLRRSVADIIDGRANPTLDRSDLNAVTTASPARLIRSVIAVVFILCAVSLTAVSSASAASERPLPAPSKYNTAPSCPVSANNSVCSPWNVPVDPNNQMGSGDYGGCEYWAAEKRPDIIEDATNNDPMGSEWEAWTWAAHARAQGLAVDGNPQPGDIVVWSQQQDGFSAGHVAYVEAVNVDGQGSIVTTGMDMPPNYGEGYTELLLAKPWAAGSYDGWQGLTFIHRYYAPGANNGSSSHGGGGSSTGTHHAAKPVRLRLRSHRRQGQTVTLVFSVTRQAKGQAGVTVVHQRQYRATAVKHHRGWWKVTVAAPAGSIVTVFFRGASGWKSEDKTITV